MAVDILPVVAQSSSVEDLPEHDAPPAEPAEAVEVEEQPPASPAPTPRMRQLMARYDGPADFNDTLRLAGAMSKARHTVPEAYRGNAGDILAVMRAAQSLDIPIAVAMHNLHYSPEGRQGMSALLMKALIMRAGHSVHDVEVGNGTRCRLRFERADGQPGGEVTWAITEAQGAKLLDKKGSPWQAYPADMLYWRALGRGARRYMSDIVLGFCYVVEAGELDDDHDVDDRIRVQPQDLTNLDADGNPIPDQDVIDLLADAAELDVKGLRALWKRASESALLDMYAGMVDGERMLVREILVDLNNAAQERERAQAMEAQAAKDAALEANPGDVDAPAGEGNLACGCPSWTVLSTGEHMQGVCSGLGV